MTRGEQPWTIRFWPRIAALVFAFSGLAIFVGTPLGNRGTPPVAQSILAGAVAVLVIARGLQVRVVVTEDDVEVHNFFRTSSWNWDEIVGFETPAGWRMRTTIVLADGDTRTVEALSLPFYDPTGYLSVSASRVISRIERSRP
jgi:Bacterial PH domain